MKTLLMIDTAPWGMLFSLAYLAAFIIAAGIMIIQGLKKRYPPGSWLLIMMTGVVFFIIGDKVSTYSPAQWALAYKGLILPAAVEKNALGGIIGLFACLSTGIRYDIASLAYHAQLEKGFMRDH